jgi:hypothetical protein
VEVSFIGGGNPEKKHQPGASHWQTFIT